VTTRTITIRIGWAALALFVLVAAGTVWILNHTIGGPPPTNPWPTVTTTVTQPEDLGRNTS
jgi:hypothetical protein